MVGPGTSGRVLLDACCLLNVFASRRIEEILRSSTLRFAVADMVVREALFVRRGGSGDDADETEPVDLQPLLATGLLQRLTPDSDDEIASFVQLASQLDDGEAMTCALAVHRGYAVATDDRKALRLIGTFQPALQVFTTGELVKAWVDAAQPPATVVTRALLDIRERARFMPRRQDPLYLWWYGLLGAG